MKKYLLAAALVMVSASAMAVTTEVRGEGKSEYCYSESRARNLAYSEAENKARDACRKLDGRLGKKFDNGNESVEACTDFEKGKYKFVVSDVLYECILK